MRQICAVANGIATFIIFGLSVAVMGGILSYMSYGFDFTDEAYYLVWMKDPFYYDFSNSQFGFIYSPLFHAVSQDPRLMRIAGIVVTYATGLVLSYVTLAEIEGHRHFSPLRAVQAMALSTLTIVFLSWAPATPSYNSLSLQALMIATIGLVRAGKDIGWSSLIGWALIGIGGWLAFMAKVSTAAVLAPLIVLLVLLSGRWSFRGLAVAGGSASLLLVASAYCIDGSLSEFWARIRVALEILALAGAGYTFGDILRWDSLAFTAADWKIAITVGAAFIISAMLFQLRMPALAVWLRVAVCFLCCVITVLIMTRVMPAYGGSNMSVRAVVLVLPAASLVLAIPALVRQRTAGISSKIGHVILRNYALGLGFIVMPLVYSFGSNNNYWALAGDASIFWALAGILFGAPIQADCRSEGRHTPFALAALLLSSLFIQHGLARPYRQPQPLWQNDQAVELGYPSHSLTLSSGFAAYIKEASSQARTAGFRPQMPVIDLSGQSPGILFAIGAKNIGYPWLSGGYTGSAAIVRAALKRAACSDLAVSWILLERNGPRKVDSSVLSVFGADIEEDFIVVAQWVTAAGVGGYSEVRVQELLRPTRSPADALTACSAATGKTLRDTKIE